MANRAFRNDQKQFEQGIVEADGQVVLSPVGTVGTTSCSIPYASASMLSGGLYRVQFQDPYVAVRSVQMLLENTGSQALYLKMSGSANNASGRYADFYLTNAGGTPTKASNAVTVNLTFKLKNSGV